MFNGTGSVAYASGTPPAPWLLIGERDRRGGVGNGPLPHRVKPHHPTQPVLLPVDAALGAEPRQDDIQRKLLELDHVKALIQDIKRNGGLTDPVVVRAGIHPKAMPVILTTSEEVDLWLEGETPDALKLERPLPEKTGRQTDIHKTARAQTYWNRWAAAATAATVLCQAVATALSKISN